MINLIIDDYNKMPTLILVEKTVGA